jgi:DNA-directed RNA polymerase specialized sigma24 family protein
MQEHPTSQSEEDGIPIEQRRVHAVLYRSYAPALFEYIRNHTTASNDAEDILTEVFIGALQHDLSEMSSDQQRAWLWTVARNKVNDYYRQVHRRPQISLEALRETLENGTNPELLTPQAGGSSFLAQIFATPLRSAAGSTPTSLHRRPTLHRNRYSPQ